MEFVYDLVCNKLKWYKQITIIIINKLNSNIEICLFSPFVVAEKFGQF